MSKINLGRVKGLSAYEVWKAQGNAGTVEDYLASLKGAKGADGYTPQKGEDYFTDAEKQEFINSAKYDDTEVKKEVDKLSSEIDDEIVNQRTTLFLRNLSTDLAWETGGYGISDGTDKTWNYSVRVQPFTPTEDTLLVMDETNNNQAVCIFTLNENDAFISSTGWQKIQDSYGSYSTVLKKNTRYKLCFGNINGNEISVAPNKFGKHLLLLQKPTVENTEVLTDTIDSRIWSKIYKNSVYFRKTGAATAGSTFYPMFTNESKKIGFIPLNDESHVIIAKDGDNNFVDLMLLKNEVRVVTCNSLGSYTASGFGVKYSVKVNISFKNKRVEIHWIDDNFYSIYVGEKLLLIGDIRKVSSDYNIKVFGFCTSSSGSFTTGKYYKLFKPQNIYKSIDTVNVLGDSFTDNTRDVLGEGTFYFARWYEFARDMCGIDTVNNYGFGGTQIATGINETNSFFNRAKSMNIDANAVFVLGGTNDWGNNIILGDINSIDNKTFYGALNGLCEYLKDAYAGKPIVFSTPIMRVSPADTKTESAPANKQTNANGNTLEEFANAMLEVCGKWGIPCFDAYHNSMICPQNRTSANFKYYMNDGIHMKQEGHMRLGIEFGNFAKRFI